MSGIPKEILGATNEWLESITMMLLQSKKVTGVHRIELDVSTENGDIIGICGDSRGGTSVVVKRYGQRSTVGS